jgi:hypothetical protein
MIQTALLHSYLPTEQKDEERGKFFIFLKNQFLGLTETEN